MLKAIIVDDEKKGAKTLKLLLAEYCPDVQVLEMVYAADEAVKRIKDLKPDLVFLDIQMPFADGFSIFEKLEGVNFEVIFTTAYNEHAIKAFRHNAIDYLLKPVNPPELINAVKKCSEKLSLLSHHNKLQNQLNFFKEALTIRKIAVHTRTEVTLIDMEDIVRFEADGNYSIINLLNGKKISSTKSLADYEKSVPEGLFMRIHKKNLINRSYVNTFNTKEGLIIMVDGSVLEVSRLKKSFIFSLLTR